MPMLNWLGKNEVIRHARNIPYHVLNHKYNFGGESDNMIIHGDNLLALRSLLPEYECRVKCIYIDPPYNTGNENWVYNDNVNSAQIQRWLHQVVGKDDLSRHDKWLCMMYPRLSLLKRLLAEVGAIFISIDDNEVANLRLLCNEIFGEQNFLAEFCVKRSGGRQDSKFYAIVNEYIVCYAKSIDNFVAGKDVKVGESYPKFDNTCGKYYKTQLLRKWGSNSRRIDRPNLFYPITAPDGTEVFPMLPDGTEGRWRWGKDKMNAALEGCWRWGKSKMQTAIDNNMIEFVNKNGEWIAYEKIYQPEGGAGTKKFTTWIDNAFNGSEDVKNLLGDNAFDYPKAVGLIERVLNMCNVDGDSIVLDSFAGSGTTAHAVLNLNAQDGGNRRFILVEMEDYAESITAERVKRVINGYGKVDGTGGNFNFYEVGESLVVDDELNDDIDIAIIRSYIWFSETRTRYVKPISDNSAYLGMHNDTAYYFHHERGTITNLDDEFLRGVVDAAHYVIYADKCTLDESDIDNYNITFKKIPRDVR